MCYNELKVLLPTRERSGYSLLRERLFTERERTMLELLAPYLARAMRPARPPLTDREHEILGWVARGKTNKEIARILGITPNTVRTHLEHVYEKLGVHTRTGAVRLTNGVA